MNLDIIIEAIDDKGNVTKEAAVRLIKITKKMLSNGYIKRLLGSVGTVTMQKNGAEKLMILTDKGNKHVKPGIHIGETWRGNWHILNKSKNPTEDRLIWPLGGSPIWRR